MDCAIAQFSSHRMFGAAIRVVTVLPDCNRAHSEQGKLFYFASQARQNAGG